MSADAQLGRRLKSLNNTAECIKATTQLFYALSFRARDAVRLWLGELRGSATDRRLPFLYVANDVMQHRHPSRKAFVQEFTPVMEQAMQLFAQHSTTRRKAGRVLKIWKDRNVMSKRSLEHFHRALDSGSSSSHSDNRSRPVPGETPLERERRESGAPPPKKQKVQQRPILEFAASTETVISTTNEEPLDPLVQALAKIEKKEKEDREWKKKKEAVRPELLDANSDIKTLEESELLTTKSLLARYHNYLQDSIGVCKSVCETIEERVSELQEAQDSTDATIESTEAMAEVVAKMQQVQESSEWQQAVEEHERHKAQLAQEEAERRQRQLKEVLESPRLIIAKTSPAIAKEVAKEEEDEERKKEAEAKKSAAIDVEEVDEDDDKDGEEGMIWNATTRTYVKRHSSDNDAWRRS